LNKIAVTGVNGAGKSTLLKCITGETVSTSGKSTVGASVNLGYFSQYSCESLSPENTIWEEVSNRLPAASVGYLRNLLGTFMFSGDDIEKKIRMLSGGEKSRVMLACILATPVNFLILDEPTNHLDIDSRETLLQALKDFEGTIMIVSHDRYFLRSIVNRVFEIDHGEMRIYDGNYDYYLEKTAHKHHH
jgi:ATP-binding cassette subfamily F protein 3